MASGDLRGSKRHFEAGLALYQRERHGQHAHVFGGHDPGVCAYACGAMTVWTLGYPDAAVRLADQGVALAQELAQPPTLAHALWFAAEIRVLRREPLEVERHAASLLPLAAKHGSNVGTANASMLHGWALVFLGRIEEGFAELQKGLKAWRATGSKTYAGYRLGRAADAYRMAGRLEEAWQLISEALDFVARTGDRWFEAELHRLRGALLSSGRNEEQAEACYRRALAGARDQDARLFELRAATGLACLLRDRSRQHEAAELVAPIYGWFTEGFETADLREAKALLESLR